MKYTAYIRSITEDTNNLKILIGIYDGDVAPEDREETTETLFIPPNQPDDYIRERVKEILNKYKAKKTDLNNKLSLIGEIFT